MNHIVRTVTRLLLIGALLGSAFGVLSGCSNKRDLPTLPGAHLDSWMDKSSVDFHGDVVGVNGYASCTVCHGEDFDGGKVGVSCIECHRESAMVCTGCHGGVDNNSGAPPAGLEIETSDTALAVGAHTPHMQGDGISDGVQCEACHHVPPFILDSLHLGGPGGQVADGIAEVIWHNFADGGGATWDRNARTCAGTYCHGNFPGGYHFNTPVWTGGNQAYCGSCHDIGTDPERLLWEHEFHLTVADLVCADCHASVADSNNTIIGFDLHVNGRVDTLTRDTTVCAPCHSPNADQCVFCHGGVDNRTGAPPQGLEGETLTSELAVGAHTAHLETGFLVDAFDCSECHLVPGTFADPGHYDTDSIAEITWGGLAGPASSWNRQTAQCTNVYCHGNFPGGYHPNAPLWTADTQAHCGSCHDIGYDPASLLWEHDFHVRVADLACADCHASVVDESYSIVGLDLHVNGHIDTLTRDTSVCAPCHSPNPDHCVACHGGMDNQTGAPPLGLQGESLTSELAVGAHTAHLEAGLLADGFDCSECHLVPTTFADSGHYDTDSIAEMTWGNLAGTASNWNRGTEQCDNVYCHGNFPGGYTSNAPIWTSPDQSGCGSCHDDGTNPQDLLGRHDKHVRDKDIECYHCHAATVDALLNVVGRDRHANGSKDVMFFDQGNFSNGTCSGLGNDCHGSKDWY